MSTDNRTAAEIAYDAQRDGSAYVRQPEPPEDIKRWIDQGLCNERFAAGVRDGLAIGAILSDTPIDAAEQAAILALYPELAPVEPKENTNLMIEILTAIDGGEDEDTGIDQRFDRVIDAVFDLPDAQRSAAITLLEGFLAGIAAAA